MEFSMDLPEGIRVEMFADARDPRAVIYRFTDARHNVQHDATVTDYAVEREMERRGLSYVHPTLGPVTDRETLVVKAKRIADKLAYEMAMPHLLRARFDAERRAVDASR